MLHLFQWLTSVSCVYKIHKPTMRSKLTFIRQILHKAPQYNVCIMQLQYKHKKHFKKFWFSNQQYLHVCFIISRLGVMNYPRKGKKKAAREARTSVSVLCRKTPTDEEFLITQRPPTGLFRIIVVCVKHVLVHVQHSILFFCYNIHMDYLGGIHLHLDIHPVPKLFKEWFWSCFAIIDLQNNPEQQIRHLFSLN